MKRKSKPKFLVDRGAWYRWAFEALGLNTAMKRSEGETGWAILRYIEEEDKAVL